MTEYQSVVDWTDLQDNDHIYRAGDPYPREGVEVSEERIEELSTTKNKRKEVLIEAVNIDENPKEPVSDENETNGNDDIEGDFPKHTGGPYYELSNGEKVKGKDAAVEAEKALQD